MISCSKCGFNNDEKNERCKKCFALLHTPVQKKSVGKQPAPASDKLINDQSILKSNYNSCIVCHYPMIVNDNFCPNCNTVQPGSAAVENSVPFSGTEHINTPVKIKKTEMLKVYNARLIPLNYQSDILNIESDKFTIGKEHIDKDDALLTDDDAFIFECKDDKWFLDAKALKSRVFLNLKSKVQIEDGDTIIFGNGKVIEFRINTPKTL